MSARASSMSRSAPGWPIAGFGMALLLMYGGGAASAFPLSDPSNDEVVPQGTDLSSPDVQSLQHQLQLVNGLSPPAGGGWTVLPRFAFQEMLTDNVFQVNTPRVADAVSYFSPGIGIAGDLPRIQLTLDYAPTMALYARSSSLDAISQQLNAVGLLTVVPDLAFIDVRALSGVQSVYGGIGGLGTLGASPSATTSAQATIPSLAGNTIGLNKDNETQTSSFSISPYLLRQFGDWGVGKLGYSLNVTHSDTISGFASPPFPTGGNSGQTLITSEEIAHFATGDDFQLFQNSFDVDLSQSRTQTGGTFVTSTTGLPSNNLTSSSTREIVSDKVTYQVNRSIAVFVSGGHEDIVYGGNNEVISAFTSQIGPGGVLLNPTYTYTNAVNPAIHDLIWSFGTTLIPNPDSLLTISYGHQNGANSLTVNGHYAATSRTAFTVSYGTTLGTQLENVQNGLQQATVTSGGALSNGQTALPLLTVSNALGTQDGVYRTTALTFGSQTTLDRDIFSINFVMATQTQIGASAASTSTSKTVGGQWLHEMQPDMTLSGAVSFALQDQAVASTLNAGNNWSIAASFAWVYQISSTLNTSLRYSFIERQSNVAAADVLQNSLILGFSKTF